MDAISTLNDLMTQARYINELLERIERLKQVNDEQAAVLTACQDENERLCKLISKHLGEQDG